MEEIETDENGLIVFDGLFKSKNDPEELNVCFCRGYYYPQDNN